MQEEIDGTTSSDVSKQADNMVAWDSAARDSECTVQWPAFGGGGAFAHHGVPL